MGLFSNPKCPKCGRETSVGGDGLTYYYKCDFCIRENREKKALEKRLKLIEAELEELKKRGTNGS